MQQRKLRVIKPEQIDSTIAYGITIPPDIAIFFREVYFTITKTGNTIILTSGTHYSDIIKSIKNTDVKLEDFKV